MKVAGILALQNCGQAGVFTGMARVIEGDGDARSVGVIGGDAGRLFARLLERWAHRITGVLFIGTGISYCLVYIFRVL